MEINARVDSIVCHVYTWRSAPYGDSINRYAGNKGAGGTRPPRVIGIAERPLFSKVTRNYSVVGSETESTAHTMRMDPNP